MTGEIFKQQLFKVATWVLLLGCLLLVLQTCSKQRQINKLEGVLETQIETIKKQKDSIIKSKLSQIDSLNIANKILVQKIDVSKSKVDSLEKIKRQVRIIYKGKIKEIEGFNGDELKNYWEDELK
jgi:hypothetical protein